MKVSIIIDRDIEIDIIGEYSKACKGSKDTQPQRASFDISGLVCSTPQDTLSLAFWARCTPLFIEEIEEKALDTIDNQ